MLTLPEVFEAVTSYSHPLHFAHAEELLVHGAGGGKRLVLVAPPRFAMSTWLQAVVGYRLATRHGEVAFYSAGHGAMAPERTTGLARRAHNRIYHFARATQAAGWDGRLAITFNPKEPTRYDFIAVDAPLQVSASAESHRIATQQALALAEHAQPEGDMVVCLQGRQEVAGGDMAHLLREAGWEVHTVPAVTEAGPTFPALWPLERLEKTRREVGEEAWRRLFLCLAPTTHLTQAEALERIGAITQRKYACHEARELAVAVRKVLSLLMPEQVP